MKAKKTRGVILILLETSKEKVCLRIGRRTPNLGREWIFLVMMSTISYSTFQPQSL
jgi:hypothetical protein